MFNFWLDEVTYNTYLNDSQMTIHANLKSPGTAWVTFSKPQPSLSEEDLVNLLTACRKARRAYKAANSVK